MTTLLHRLIRTSADYARVPLERTHNALVDTLDTFERDSGAKRIGEDEHPELHAMAAQLAQDAFLPAPGLYIVASSPAISSKGLTTQGSIHVGEQLLNYPANLLRGALAHEMGHIKNMDGQIFSLASLAACAGSMCLAGAVAGAVAGPQGEHRGLAVFTFCSILFVTFSAIKCLGPLGPKFSQSREYLADTSAARMLGDAGPLIDVLLEMERRYGPPSPTNAGLSRLVDALSSHPPVPHRVERLRELQRTSDANAIA